MPYYVTLLSESTSLLRSDAEPGVTIGVALLGGDVGGDIALIAAIASLTMEAESFVTPLLAVVKLYCPKPRYSRTALMFAV